ncbi:MAG TPA: PfkB family carbohydrate kinase [Syntrophales bacterium]|jgi:sugar/nucleoside kinase (ribokinase family)|nr:PfkB family carbohydrate kinase [Syntrophales bacterium]HON22536.1 PfkB family carbohydrate kinase [Syntrophales bacterium]HOU76771.1 PfkB family carbohydrate kinase [Syntrophales bacterium]HPC31894.1 PfkB family carbohydrate kinase [Syntrophales bacterium]HQG33556.1 PfkB family carbohydrate kinase [Syntrophales bacterium]
MDQARGTAATEGKSPTVIREGNFPVIAVGSGAFESVIRCDGPLQLGRKQIVRQEESLGGSGLNYTLRLLRAGRTVLPILPVGNDPRGRLIRESIARAAAVTGTPLPADFLSPRKFFVPRLCTPRSTILISQGQTTVFSEKFVEGKNFRRHLEKRFHDIEHRLAVAPGGVIIGHIYSDKDNGHPHVPGECTRYIIDHWQGKAPVFLNLGHSQIGLGIAFWEDAFRKTAVIQMNVWEFKQLMKTAGRLPSLRKIITWFTERRINAVISMGRFGALGVYADGKDGLIYAQSLLPPERVLDATGAGDAFAAGLAAALTGSGSFTFADFRRAMAEAGVWASFACTTIGGSGYCPGRQELAAFREELGEENQNSVKIVDLKAAGPMLDMMDLLYS